MNLVIRPPLHPRPLLSESRVQELPGRRSTGSAMKASIRELLAIGLLEGMNVKYFIAKVLGVGDVFVYPKGLLNFQQNLGKGNASANNFFISQLPGTMVVPVTLFGQQPPIPDEVLLDL